MSKVLAVVGSRKPNAAQRERCQQAVRDALEAGWRIVTGGAPGIDHLAVLTAQRAGFAERVTLVLPWQGFEGWQDQRIRYVVYDPEEHADWLDIARRQHPAPHRVREGAWPPPGAAAGGRGGDGGQRLRFGVWLRQRAVQVAQPSSVAAAAHERSGSSGRSPSPAGGVRGRAAWHDNGGRAATAGEPADGGKGSMRVAPASPKGR